MISFISIHPFLEMSINMINVNKVPKRLESELKIFTATNAFSILSN